METFATIEALHGGPLKGWAIVTRDGRVVERFSSYATARRAFDRYGFAILQEAR